MRIFFLLSLVVSIVVGGSEAPGQDAVAERAPKAKPTLEATYRMWYAGFSSKKMEEREKTLRSMMPTQKDLQYLFPKHAKQLWPKFEKGIEFLAKNADKIADEVTKGGELKAIEAIDIRKIKDRTPGYKRLLEIIPKDVAIFDIRVTRAERSSGGGTYLYLHERWIWINDLDTFPEMMEKMK